MLSCGHVACLKDVQDLKENTGLKKVTCLKYNENNSLEINYFESNLIKNFMNLCSDKILESLKQEFEKTLKQVKSKNFIK